jgi:hypothetical protein
MHSQPPAVADAEGPHAAVRGERHRVLHACLDGDDAGGRERLDALRQQLLSPVAVAQPPLLPVAERVQSAAVAHDGRVVAIRRAADDRRAVQRPHTPRQQLLVHLLPVPQLPLPAVPEGEAAAVHGAAHGVVLPRRHGSDAHAWTAVRKGAAAAAAREGHGDGQRLVVVAAHAETAVAVPPREEAACAAHDGGVRTACGERHAAAAVALPPAQREEPGHVAPALTALRLALRRRLAPVELHGLDRDRGRDQRAPEQPRGARRLEAREVAGVEPRGRQHHQLVRNRAERRRRIVHHVVDCRFTVTFYHRLSPVQSVTRPSVTPHFCEAGFVVCKHGLHE